MPAQSDWSKAVCLFRYREVSPQANARQLDALAALDDPVPGNLAPHRLSTANKDAAGRSCLGFNALTRHLAALLKSLMVGEYCQHGFSHQDLRARDE